jgi:hypothetical protein
MIEGNELLTAEDLRDLLIGFAAAIELDQIRVDALPPEKFHPEYDDGMWRRWRRNHLEYIHKLLPSIDEIPSTILKELSQAAIAHEPAAVGQIALDLFADAASGSCAEEELENATRFFGWLIKGLSGKSPGKPLNKGARTRMMQWLPVTDPLRISRDPECSYGKLSGFVN